MSLNVNGEKCSVCRAYLFEDDDIVYCPECGAPHHRECYNSIGHCGLKEFHGTDNQYKKPEPVQEEKETTVENMVFCNVCGEKYNKEEFACPSCSAPNLSKMGGRVISVDLSGGIPDDVDLGEGVTVKDAKRFVAVNNHRYMPKFLKFKNGKKASWNWLALLSPCGWLFSRKMYMLGSVIAALQIAATMLTVPFAEAVSMIDTTASRNYIEYSNVILENISVIGEVAIYTAFLGTFIDFILRMVIAIFGDLIYKNRVIAKVKEIKQSGADSAEVFRKKGGVSILAAALGYLAVSYLPTIIAYTLGMM